MVSKGPDGKELYVHQVTLLDLSLSPAYFYLPFRSVTAGEASVVRTRIHHFIHKTIISGQRASPLKISVFRHNAFFIAMRHAKQFSPLAAANGWMNKWGQ
jgi:hypothetical protein